MVLTQKEATLIKDLKGQEQLCIDKYTKHAECASDPQLKVLFNAIAAVERSHLETLTSMENGTVPAMNGGGSAPTVPTTFTATYTVGESEQKKSDCFLCSDLLSTEKHVSHLYDTCVFEFKDESARTALNHIQKEEQRHGKAIYDYMQTNAMYS